ncbi:MAG TPA: carboxypeptidase-like regulatory domain-containing protein [Candidatus Acidoferrales bacterium]|nr:carboxypeptidase-like regulatory domain-containing protein [Candidatus Acidoferrales bacterium]
MKAFWPRLLTIALTTLFAASVSLAGTVHGSVVNRTTGKPIPNTDVDLLSPTQGMALLASVKSDAQGQFTATNDAIGTGPVLIRATYQGVSFNAFLPPGRPQVDVEVFDVTKDPKVIFFSSHVIIFQPHDGKLIGAEEYNIKNDSNPPVAFFRAEGNFEFAVPDKAVLKNVSATGSLGMDVPQASIDKGKGLYAIAYAFHPGETNIRLSYELPYPGNSANVKLPAMYGGMRMLLVAPPGVTLTGDGISAAGQEQGMNVFLHEALAAKRALTVSISGAGSPQAADASGGQQTRQEGNSRAQGQQVDLAPPRIDDFKWPLLFGLVALFALGAILLSRKQVVMAPAADREDAALAQSKKAAKAARQQPGVEAVKESVNANLDSLKEEVFRLELRKQAGTISEEDYAREKSRVDNLLRDLVRG